MSHRTVEDRLREEYVCLLPGIRRVTEELEAEVRYLLIPITGELQSYERIVVRSRVKECESAIDALRRRQEGKAFEEIQPQTYSLCSLHDLAGVRVLAFPKRRVLQIDQILRERFPTWSEDPVPGITPGTESMALKYHGYCDRSLEVRAELQIVAMLIGLFWEVEHGALYKPAPALRNIEIEEEMHKRNIEVIRALRAFEEEFDNAINSRSAVSGRHPEFN